MNTPGWTADMRLGLPQVDAGHQALLKQLRCLEQSPDGLFGAAFLALVEHLEADFREEEAIMEEMAYVGLREHREQHARVLAAMRQTAGRVLRGELASGREAAELLGEWFVGHLATHDTLFALTLELKHAERAVQEPR